MKHRRASSQVPRVKKGGQFVLMKLLHSTFTVVSSQESHFIVAILKVATVGKPARCRVASPVSSSSNRMEWSNAHMC